MGKIMESDIKRGLGRKGGAVVVDDLLITNYQDPVQRVRVWDLSPNSILFKRATVNIYSNYFN